MRLVVGLGNPGTRYAGTRHNFGFQAIEQIARSMDLRITQSKFNSIYALGRYRGEQYLLVKPLTYMNLSGQAVRMWVDFYRVEPQKIMIIYDEIDLDLGRIRLREAGSAGGHNGMKSIIQHLGDDAFPRLRLGIGPQPKMLDAADFVLQPFRPREWEIVEQVVQLTSEIVVCWSHEGLTRTMNRYNGWTASQS